MTTEIVFLHKCIILDAYCIVNLYASGHFDSILEAIPASVTIATYVQEEETLKVYAILAEDGTQVQKKIDLQPYINRRLLLPVSLEAGAENAIYTDFLHSIDKGEAVTGAIAVHRNWAIGSDDGQARKFFARVAPNLQVLSTPDFLKYWADTTEPAADIVRAALQDVLYWGHYKPSIKHPLGLWWETCISG